MSLPDEHAQGRRGPRARRVLQLAALAGLAAAAGWVVLASPLLDVERVAVTGSARATPAQVLAAAAVAPGTPLARVDLDAVRRRVTALDPVADVVVERSWPSALRLRVTEREPAVGFLTAGKYVLIDADGIPFAREAALPAGAVRLQVERPATDDPATRAALDVLGELPESLRSRIGIVRATSPGAVTLLLRDGKQVVWGGPDRSGDKVAAAEALLRLPGSVAGTVYDVSSPEVVSRREPVAEGVAAAAQG